MLRRFITIRPNAPWYSHDISIEKSKRRKLERRWRKTGLKSDRDLYVQQCNIVNAMLTRSKTEYYSNLIQENQHDQKVLFKTVGKLLHRKADRLLPSHASLVELNHRFADFFASQSQWYNPFSQCKKMAIPSCQSH